MANEEHLKILKQGVGVWNKWREENPNMRPDLREANFSGNLIGAQLYEADLSDAKITRSRVDEADLRRANLRRASFYKSVLTNAQLYGADLLGVRLIDASLVRANLRRAHLTMADLGGAILYEADLSHADLRWTSLIRASLNGANFSGVIMGQTLLGDVDLSRVRGLEAVVHRGPSTIGIDTIYRSKGKIPEVFLRGAGVPDSTIEFMHSLVRSEKAIDFYSCFISYSSKDRAFAERLHADLQDKGVRCWFAQEDMKIGDRIRPTLDQSVRTHDKLLIILSKNSIGSDWVEQEVETALARERQEKRTVLFPIRLDDAVMEIDVGWPALIRNTRHIGDFRNWEDHDPYQQAFGRLLHDLAAEDTETRDA